MDTLIAQEIIKCLPSGRTIFHYFKDRYSPILLKYIVGNGKKISEIKSSNFGKLLSKPIVKPVLAKSGNGEIAAQDFDNLWDQYSEPFILTLGTWGDDDWKYNQTSRPGVNLVLQLNFSGVHDEYYNKLIKPSSGTTPFDYGCHPTNKSARNTLAWARIDLDLQNNEALIEEIQNDWLRIADRKRARMMRYISNNRVPNRYEFQGINCSYQELNEYVAKLENYKRIWDEAMLAAAIWFIRDEIGITNIFYHTHETGSKLKHIDYAHPPKSIYTKLPKQFCFSETEQIPIMLESNSASRRLMKKIKYKQWYYLEL
ncbi:MAG: hypothetical protein D6B28_06940 [Gammaproteobacteria bacterium]|nr:MAG: hypothetical protein D6B28_06940 [Gammaproteobacteria bacterium]